MERVMRIMTRKVGESIVIDGKVVIKVLTIRGDRVRMAVTNPEHLPVHRDEVIKELSTAAREALNPACAEENGQGI
jgi:carbon storage regulator